MIEKRYRFARGTDVLAEETLHLGFYRRTLMDCILEQAGFVLDRIDDESRFFVYRKIPLRHRRVISSKNV